LCSTHPGREKKLKRLKEKKLWLLPDSENLVVEHSTTSSCDYGSTFTPWKVLMLPPRLEEMVVTIKVLPSSALHVNLVEERLRRLVDSILRANYDSTEGTTREKQINIELHVPLEKSDSQQPFHGMFLNILKELETSWKLGEVRLIEDSHQAAPLTSVENRLKAWDATSYNEAAIMIDDDMEVSGQWWLWVRYSLETYCSLDTHEPRLFGAVLEASEEIIAIEPVAFLACWVSSSCSQ